MTECKAMYIYQISTVYQLPQISACVDSRSINAWINEYPQGAPSLPAKMPINK